MKLAMKPRYQIVSQHGQIALELHQMGPRDFCFLLGFQISGFPKSFDSENPENPDVCYFGISEFLESSFMRVILLSFHFICVEKKEHDEDMR